MGKEEGGELGTQSPKAMFSYVALVGKWFNLEIRRERSIEKARAL